MANEQITASSKEEPKQEPGGASCSTSQTFNNTVGAIAILVAATLGYLAYVAFIK